MIFKAQSRPPCFFAWYSLRQNRHDRWILLWLEFGIPVHPGMAWRGDTRGWPLVKSCPARPQTRQTSHWAWRSWM